MYLQAPVVLTERFVSGSEFASTSAMLEGTTIAVLYISTIYCPSLDNPRQPSLNIYESLPRLQIRRRTGSLPETHPQSLRFMLQKKGIVCIKPGHH